MDTKQLSLPIDVETVNKPSSPSLPPCDKTWGPLRMDLLPTNGFVRARTMGVVGGEIVPVHGHIRKIVRVLDRSSPTIGAVFQMENRGSLDVEPEGENKGVRAFQVMRCDLREESSE